MARIKHCLTKVSVQILDFIPFVQMSIGIDFQIIDLPQQISNIYREVHSFSETLSSINQLHNEMMFTKSQCDSKICWLMVGKYHGTKLCLENEVWYGMHFRSLNIHMCTCEISRSSTIEHKGSWKFKIQIFFKECITELVYHIYYNFNLKVLVW